MPHRALVALAGVNLVPLMVVLWLCALSAGGALLVVRPWLVDEPGVRRTVFAFLGVCVIASTAAYFRLGELHELKGHGSQNFHAPESYHYFLGSKWFEATGHYELYTCSMTALDELGREGRKTTTGGVRDLRSKLDFISLGDVLERHGPACRERFGDDWPAFKADVATYLDIFGDANPLGLRQTLFDAGYNSSPVFPALYGTLAKAMPLASTWKWHGLADIALMVAALVMVGRAMGAPAVLGFLLVFTTNPVATYLWTGGSWFRHAWAAALVAALASLADRRFALAGACFGYMAAERGFPTVFFAGACLPVAWAAWGSVEARRDFGWLLAGFFVTAAVLVAYSVALYGTGAWVDFVANARSHGALMWIPHVGFKKLFAFDPAVEAGNYWFEAGTPAFRAFENGAQARFAAHRPAWLLATGFALLATARASITDRPERAALLFGTVTLFTLTVPAAYYFELLALFPAAYALNRRDAVGAAQLAASFLLVAVLFWCERAADNIILRFDFFSMAITGFLTVLVVLRFIEEGRQEAGAQPPTA